MSAPVALVVFDWAGTVIDFGCRAPVAGFVDAFAAAGVAVSEAEARGPMGRHKRDHVRNLLSLPAVSGRWRAARGRDWTEADVEALYEDAGARQLAAIARHAELIAEVPACVAELRSRGAKIGGTTGYFREAAELCAKLGAEQGYAPDANVGADEVPAGRPAPWMLFRLMERLGVYPAGRVVKVGDTPADVGEALAAGAWAVGVVDSGNEVGLPRDAWEALPAAERDARRAAARARLLAAGAHRVVDTLAELPGVVAELGGG